MKEKKDKEQKDIDKILKRVNKDLKKGSFVNENPNFRNTGRY